MIELTDAAGLPSLTEQTIFPAERRLVGEREVAFPVQSDRLTPITIHPMTLDIPRFSLFSTPEIDITGFRLLGLDGRYAHDESLVGDPEEMTAYYRRKFEIGQRENVPDPFPPEDGIEPDVIDIGGEVLVVSSDEPPNYGSWIYRVLPKILMGTDARHVAGIFLYSPWDWMKTTLEVTRFGGRVIHHEPMHRYRIRNAVIPSLPAPQAFLRPEVRSALWSLHARAPSQATLGDKIYVSRRGQAIKRHGFRVLENETAIVERLAERGFAEFIPENYSLPDQIAIFDKARVIVGCGGSNMFGCLFSRNARFIVDLESSDEWLFAHRNVFASTNASFTMVRGVPTGRGNSWHRNWVIDDDALIDGLGRLGLA